MDILQDRIVFHNDDFINGLINDFTANAIPKKLGTGYRYGQIFDPINVNQGYAYPGYKYTDSANTVGTVDALLVDASVAVSNGVYAYMIGGSKLHRLDITTGTGGTVSNTGSWPHTIAGAGTHAAHSGFSDALGSVVGYNVAGVQKLFYSWNDATDWDVGMYDLSASFTDNYMTGTAATPLAGSDLTGGKGKYHPLYVSGVDDLMYIGSGRYVHSFDGGTGANGTFYAETFICPTQYDVKGFAETGYDLVVFVTSNADSGRRGIAKARFYGADRPADPYKILPLDDDDVSAPFNFKGTVGCFTQNRTGRVTLRLFNGSSFQPKFYYTGSLPSVGGVEIQGDLIKWNSAGYIYQWGSKDGVLPVSAHCTNFAGDSSGFVKSFSAGNLWTSAAAGSSGSCGVFDTTTYDSSGTYKSMVAYPNFPGGKKGRVKAVHIHFAKSCTSGRQVSLRILTDGESTNTTIISSIGTVSNNQLIQQFRYDASGNPLPFFKDLSMWLLWNSGTNGTDAPGIERVEVFYELRNII